MASNEDENFKRSVDSACSRGRSKAQMSVGKIPDIISAAAPPPNSQPYLCRDGETFFGGNVERRGFLTIDLNVAPPEDGDYEFPEAISGGNGQEIRPTVAAVVASDVSENKLGEVVADVHSGRCEGRNGIQAHWSKREINVSRAAEDEEKHTKTPKIIADPEVETRGEKDSKNIGWVTLLEVAENALREHEGNLRNKEEKIQNRKRRPSREVELGGELHKPAARKKITGHRRQSCAAEWNHGSDVATAAAVLATPVVVRSTRGRALAMPNKYRDSVIDAVAVAVAVAEAELPRHNKSGKSATVVSTKRKSR